VGIPGITAGTDIAFDQVPPAPSPGISETGIYSGYDSSAGTGHLNDNLSAHNLLAVWTDTAHPPTGAQCSDWATTHPLHAVPVQKGTMVCLKTDDKHNTALLTIVSISEDDGSMIADVTLWGPSD
jgi:hypothetical protein